MVECGAGFRVPRVSYQRLWNDRTMLWLVMTQVCPDGARPVDVGMTRSTSTLRAVERPSQGLARVVLQTAHEVVHDFAYHFPGGFKSLAWNRSTQCDEIRDKMDIGLQSRKELRFEH